MRPDVCGMNSLNDFQSVRWLRSAPVSPEFDPQKVDAESGMIRDVVMVEEGPAKGHGVHLEREFIEGIVAYDRKYFSVTGLKARFGHPSASSETMGTQLGIYSNFRKRINKGKMQAIADLQLLDAAEQSPTHPGMKSWVLQMAQERPDFIMSSIVFRGSGEYQRKPNGHKHRLDDYGENYKEEYGNVFMEFDEENGAAHYYTDLVEQGAATDSLFSTAANPHLFVSRAHQFLDDNPDLLAFVKQHPDKVQAFLSRLGISISQPQQKKMSKFSLTDWLLGKTQDADPTAEDLETLKTELSAVRGKYTALQTEKDALENRVEELSAGVNTLQATVAQYKSELETLRTDLAAKNAEIEALKSEGADDHTGGDTQPAGGEASKRAYQKTEVNIRVQQMRERAKKQS